MEAFPVLASFLHRLSIQYSVFTRLSATSLTCSAPSLSEFMQISFLHFNFFALFILIFSMTYNKDPYFVKQIKQNSTISVRTAALFCEVRAFPQTTPCGVSGTSKCELLPRLFAEIETRVFVGIFKREKGKNSFSRVRSGTTVFLSLLSQKCGKVSVDFVHSFVIDV